MSNHFSNPISRRGLLKAGAGFAALAFPALRPAQAAIGNEYRITAKKGRVPLLGGRYPETAVWHYNGAVPGPEIRVRQGERLRVAVENRLDEETTVHWHGMRVPNAMDGVPHLTQAPIAPGETFVYAFDCPDAGTFWYHPHQRGSEQVGRGLYGPLIVEEPEPIPVDRDVTWVLDDWRLLRDGQISDDFDNMMDAGMAGRIGNTATVNGRLPETFAVRGGERIRLRLINAANARIFALAFEGHRPRVVALDGQPVEPHAPEDDRVVLGPAMRADLVIDMTGTPGARFQVIDTFYRDLEYRLLDLVYADRPLREAPPDTPLRLPDNPLAEPDLATAERHEITFGGGMMSGMMGGGMMDGGMPGRDMGRMMDRMMPGMRHGGVWTVNGIAAEGHVMDPMLTLARGRSYVLALHNDTAWHHPIHLHGHSFRVLGREGTPTRHREWQDTVLMAPRERVEIAFVADNPGDWMFHCHILEHQAAGMMGVIRVA
ncbi:multicopper oxidase family protein [Chelativorans alearense]|uniref:multicopper oxidase family protein n=1 Tax=Chelativorans alearense TaxID=2681495 RepID=UPI0013D23EF5|nr:multicopper oxidase family protein [Chelativorans alearense]